MITASFAIALVLEMLPWGGWLVPDFLALVLVFWNVFQPRRVGIALAWLLGILMDVHSGSLLGQHAHANSVLPFMTGVGPSWTYFVSPVLTAILWIPLTGWMMERLNRPLSSTAAIGR
jgi:cell shape-determining protein MreD